MLRALPQCTPVLLHSREQCARCNAACTHPSAHEQHWLLLFLDFCADCCNELSYFSTPTRAGPDIINYSSTPVRTGTTGIAIPRPPHILLQWIVVFLYSRAQCAENIVVLLDSRAPLVKHTTAAVDCCTQRINNNLCALRFDSCLPLKLCNSFIKCKE